MSASPRIIYFTGKGGVGKSTIATATSTGIARLGRRTLLISTDPAHSLGDVLDVSLPTGQTHSVTENFDVHQINVTKGRDRIWSNVERYLGELLGYAELDPIAAAELTDVPGVDDIVGLLELNRLISDAEHDVIVVDAPSSGEALRFLRLPEATTTLLRKLATPRLRLAQVFNRQRSLIEALEQLSFEVATLRDRLSQSETSIRLVATPDSVVLAETRRTLSALTVNGLRVDAIVVNRVFEGSEADTWRQAWAERHEKSCALLAQEVDPIRVLAHRFDDREPVGLDDLAAVCASVYHDLDPLDRLSSAPAFRVITDEQGFALVIPMPFVNPRDVHLARLGDDMVVTVADHRRSIHLPSALRRCSTEDARWRDGSMYIRFMPDPTVWPQP